MRFLGSPTYKLNIQLSTRPSKSFIVWTSINYPVRTRIVPRKSHVKLPRDSQYAIRLKNTTPHDTQQNLCAAILLGRNGLQIQCLYRTLPSCSIFILDALRIVLTCLHVLKRGPTWHELGHTCRSLSRHQYVQSANHLGGVFICAPQCCRQYISRKSLILIHSINPASSFVKVVHTLKIQHHDQLIEPVRNTNLIRYAPIVCALGFW